MKIEEEIVNRIKKTGHYPFCLWGQDYRGDMHKQKIRKGFSGIFARNLVIMSFSMMPMQKRP